MVLCKDCKYWQEREKAGDLEHGLWFVRHTGTCTKMDNDFESDDDGVYDADSMAVPVESSGYGAGVLTMPEFGCIMGEKK